MRPKKQPRCTLCTQHRWKGNMGGHEGRLKKRLKRHTNPKKDLWRDEKHEARTRTNYDA